MSRMIYKSNVNVYERFVMCSKGERMTCEDDKTQSYDMVWAAGENG